MTGYNATSESRRLAELRKTPWYHSIHCACGDCLDADALIEPREWPLKISKRPLFPDGS